MSGIGIDTLVKFISLLSIIFINLRFGRFMEFFHKLSFTFIHSFKLVSVDYDVYFKNKFDKYDDFVRDIQ